MCSKYGNFNGICVKCGTCGITTGRSDYSDLCSRRLCSAGQSTSPNNTSPTLGINDETGAPVDAFSEWHHIAREMALTQGTFGQEGDMAQLPKNSEPQRPASSSVWVDSRGLKWTM
jgi:hypothetical protein